MHSSSEFENVRLELAQLIEQLATERGEKNKVWDAGVLRVMCRVEQSMVYNGLDNG